MVIAQSWGKKTRADRDSVMASTGRFGPRRLEEIDKARETVIVCHVGGRSMQAALFLRARGYDNVYNLAGGIDAWSRTVDPGVPRYR